MDSIQPEVIRKLPLAVQQLIDADAAQPFLQLLLSGHRCTLQAVQLSVRGQALLLEQLQLQQHLAGLTCSAEEARAK